MENTRKHAEGRRAQAGSKHFVGPAKKKEGKDHRRGGKPGNGPIKSKKKFVVDARNYQPDFSLIM